VCSFIEGTFVPEGDLYEYLETFLITTLGHGWPWYLVGREQERTEHSPMARDVHSIRGETSSDHRSDLSCSTLTTIFQARKES
jgi:hypothetical protein